MQPRGMLLRGIGENDYVIDKHVTFFLRQRPSAFENLLRYSTVQNEVD